MFKLLNLCNAASLLLKWSLVSGSDKPLIKVAIEVSQHEMIPCFMNFSVSGLPSSPHYHVLQGVLFYCCRRIAAEGSQQNFHCKLFYFILLRFYSSLGETVFSKKTEYWLQMRADTQFDGKSGVDSEVKIGAGSA